MISLTKTSLGFSCTFRDKYTVGKNIVLYVDDDGFLCFKFTEESTPDSYSVTLNAGGAYFLRIPKALQNTAQKGKYDVIERDGYFVTDCKLNMPHD